MKLEGRNILEWCSRSVESATHLPLKEQSWESWKKRISWSGVPEVWGVLSSPLEKNSCRWTEFSIPKTLHTCQWKIDWILQLPLCGDYYLTSPIYRLKYSWRFASTLDPEPGEPRVNFASRERLLSFLVGLVKKHTSSAAYKRLSSTVSRARVVFVVCGGCTKY